MHDLQEKLVKLTSELSLLYVEDEDVTREQYENVFKLLFKNVKSTVNGLDGLEEYKLKQYDLIITDLTMPKMDGTTMISEIIKINPLQKIIVMTAHNTNAHLKESINFQVDGFLLKPVSMDKLLQLLFKVCEYLHYKKTTTKEISINKTINDYLDSSKAFFVVVIDNYYDIVKKFDSNIKKHIYRYVNEYLSNIGIENSTVMNEHKDALLCSVDKDKLQSTLKILQELSFHNDYIILTKNKIKIYITLSYGIIILDDKQKNNNSERILEHINSLIYEIKHDENSNSFIKMDINYEEAKKNESLSWLKLTLEALKQNNVIAFYQPIFDINALVINSYQVLARIKNKNSYILPKYFIDLSKRAGILEELSKVILEQSFEYISNYHYPFHIDIVDIDWREGHIEDYLEHLTKKFNLDKNRIILDIRDYNSLEKSSRKTKKILHLKKLGYKICLKDFGAHNINIEILSLLKPDYIKINKILLLNAKSDPHLNSAIKFLIDYINRADIKSIIVGIENKSDLELAKKFGFSCIQGFYFAKASKELYLKDKY